MRADDLKRLGEAFVHSPREFDTMFSRLLEADPARIVNVAGKAKRVYQVECVGDDVGTGLYAPEQLGALLQIAGVGPDMRKLRKLHERVPPADKNWLVPPEPWVTRYEAPLEHSPLVQAQACLRVMVPEMHTKPWAISLARTKLASLLLEYPAMLHPRFVWDFESNQPAGRVGELLPMVIAVATISNASLPSPYLGFKPNELKSFATHPLVAYALRAKSLVLDDSIRKRQRQGQSLAMHLSALSAPRFMLGHALLHIDRLRAQVGCGAPLFAGTALGREAMSNLLAQNFAAAWRKPLFSNAVSAFLDELKLSPTHPAKSHWVHFLRSAPSIFIDTRTSMAAVDQVERFDRLVSQLVSTGALQTQQIASHAVLRELFPIRHESGIFSTGPSYATASVAHALVSRWLDQGVGLEELGERIRFSRPGSVWEQVLEPLEIEHAMTASIDLAGAKVAGESGDLPATPARRCRAI